MAKVLSTADSEGCSRPFPSGQRGRGSIQRPPEPADRFLPAQLRDPALGPPGRSSAPGLPTGSPDTHTPGKSRSSASNQVDAR